VNGEEYPATDDMTVRIDALSLVDVPSALAARFGDRAAGRAVAEAFAAAVGRALSERLAGERPRPARRHGYGGHDEPDLDLLADGVAAAIAARLSHASASSGGRADE
jgi:hypothetical protein